MIIDMKNKEAFKYWNLFGLITAFDVFAWLDCANDDANGDHNNGNVLHQLVATSKVIHSR